MAQNNMINVALFGREVGRIGIDDNLGRTSFQYNEDYVTDEHTKQIFPLTGIIKRTPHVQVFNSYHGEVFKSLPPQFADSLPDVFGNTIFKAWLDASNSDEITVLEQLAYVSNRGMGALEYYPALSLPQEAAINLEEIISILKKVLDSKLSTESKQLDTAGLLNIFKIGTSAGGARPKILVSEHKETGKLIPGDLEYSEAYNHLLIKLNIEEDDSYPREVIEHCYYLAARQCGIKMMESHLIDKKHFATQRYDRHDGIKKHVLTASGITGWNFKEQRNSSYENLFKLSAFLKVPHAQSAQLYKRMIFNLVFFNIDDHLKNHSFIYDQEADRWNISPAYDVTYATNPLVNIKKIRRALSVNKKRSDILLSDVLHLAEEYTIKNPKRIIEEVHAVIPILFGHLKEHDVSDIVIRAMKKKITTLT